MSLCAVYWEICLANWNLRYVGGYWSLRNTRDEVNNRVSRHQSVSEIETLKTGLLKENDRSQLSSWTWTSLSQNCLGNTTSWNVFCSLKAQLWNIVCFCQQNETMMFRNCPVTLKITFASTALIFYKLFSLYFYLQGPVRISSLFFPVQMNIYWYNPIFLNFLLKHQSISNEILNNCLSWHKL